MQWKKFSEEYPKKDTVVLYYDNKWISIAVVRKNNFYDGLYSDKYYCNNPECDGFVDDCGCALVVKPEHYWMPLPDEPENVI